MARVSQGKKRNETKPEEQDQGVALTQGISVGVDQQMLVTPDLVRYKPEIQVEIDKTRWVVSPASGQEVKESTASEPAEESSERLVDKLLSASQKAEKSRNEKTEHKPAVEEPEAHPLKIAFRALALNAPVEDRSTIAESEKLFMSAIASFEGERDIPWCRTLGEGIKTLRDRPVALARSAEGISLLRHLITLAAANSRSWGGARSTMSSADSIVLQKNSSQTSPLELETPGELFHA